MRLEIQQRPEKRANGEPLFPDERQVFDVENRKRIGYLNCKVPCFVFVIGCAPDTQEAVADFIRANGYDLKRVGAPSPLRSPAEYAPDLSDMPQEPEAEPAEPVEPVEQAEPVEPFEPTELAEPAEVPEASGPVEEVVKPAEQPEESATKSRKRRKKEGG